MGLKRTKVGMLAIAVTLIAGCSTGSPEQEVHKAPAGSPEQCDEGGLDTTGSTDGGMVSTPDPDASKAGCKVLADGGTAADAVVAAQYVLGLTEPQYSGPGGGGLLIYHDAKSGKTSSFDGTVFAPGPPNGEIGVPQTNKLMRSVLAEYGSKPLKELVKPARRLASEGFEISDRLHEAMESRPALFPDIPEAGSTQKNKEYADYLAKLPADGKLIEPEEPLCVDYEKHKVCGSHSTATGMMIVGEALGIVNKLDVARLRPYSGDPVAARATAQHLITEAERIAFTNGNTWMADAAANKKRARDYVDKIVTNEAHYEDAAESIHQKQSLEKLKPDRLGNYKNRYEDSHDDGTSQITVRDSSGSMASLTTTLQRSFGSGEKGHGYYLNNSLDNFSEKAEDGEPNYREAGVHPRTTMSPLVVFDSEGKPYAALGSPGGRKIPSYLIKTIVGMISWEQSVKEAVEMGNFGATNRNAVYTQSEAKKQDKVDRLLSKWGHKLKDGDYDSGVSLIRVTSDNAEGAADSRRDGSVARVDSPS